MRASIVTIGTEITDGQIVDRNSNWVSQQLQKLHIPVTIHTSVPDETPLMLAAFKYALEHSELLFICGGLGPTVDDFTRDVIAQFVNQPLTMDAKSLEKIENKITARGLPVREGHHRQALLPAGATALENSYGVAPGFYLQQGRSKIWALPGPPLEIAAIWNDHVGKQLAALNITPPALTLHTWMCLGVAESEIAQITEDFFADFHFEKKYGYRIHLPYVEVKVWLEQKHPDSAKAVQLYTERIKAHFQGHNIAEVRAPALTALHPFKKLKVVDEYSEGLYLGLFQELAAQIKNLELSYHLVKAMDEVNPSTVADTLEIQIKKENAGQISWLLKTEKGEESVNLPVPERRTGHYIKLYAFEILLRTASSSALITS